MTNDNVSDGSQSSGFTIEGYGLVKEEFKLHLCLEESTEL